MTISYCSLIILILLEGAQEVWDAFHPQHFPTAITRPLLPMLFLLGGRATYHLYEHHAELFGRR